MADPSLGRMPPHSRDAERAVLGSMLRDNRVIDDVVAALGAADFYHHAHQVLFDATLTARGAGRPVDVVTLADQLAAAKKLEDVGGYGYLAELWDAAPTAANAAHYARIVRDKSAARGLIHVGTDLVRDAFDQVYSAAELMEKAERDVLGLTRRVAPTEEGVDFKVALARFMQDVEARQSGQAMAGLPTGFIDLEIRTCGMKRGELTIAAARPGVGKTTFACCVASNAAADGRRVMFVSLEMSVAEITTRMACRHARVDSFSVYSNTLSKEELDRLNESYNAIYDWPVHINDTAGQTVTRIASAARRQRQKHGLDLLIVDYAQLIEPDDRRAQRYEQISQIGRRLKFLARELEVPVLALAQLNRDVDGRPDQRPRLSDIREGGLENDADVVLMMHEQEPKVPAACPGAKLLVIDVAKNRNGRTGDVTLLHTKKYLSLESYQECP